MSIAFTIFDTAIGPCGIAWSGQGVVAVELPGSDAERTRAKLLRRLPQAVEAIAPPRIAAAIGEIVALLAGEPRTLENIVIDDRATSDFNKRVYAIVRALRPGETMTYGEVAERLGDKALARAVGQAMGENPTPIVMPCHRVLAANGKTGGFSGAGGVDTKLRILSIERAQPGGPDLFGDLPLAARRSR